MAPKTPTLGSPNSIWPEPMLDRAIPARPVPPTRTFSHPGKKPIPAYPSSPPPRPNTPNSGNSVQVARFLVGVTTSASQLRQFLCTSKLHLVTSPHALRAHR